MKTNFLFKLFLVAITCVSLYSCTADEISTAPETKIQTISTARDGNPTLTNPR